MSWGRISRLPMTRSAFPRTGSKTAPEYFSFWTMVWRWTGWMPVRRMSPAGQGPGHEEGSGLDPVGDDLVAGAAELLDALDAHRLLADPVDPRPHLHQELAEVGDLRLEGAVAEDGLALGQGGGHDQVLGSGHRLLLELDRRAGELVGLGLDVAVLEVDGRAELLEPVDVEVDGPRADGTAPGQGDDGLPEARQERAEDEDGRPHRPHQLVGGFVRGDLADPDVEGVPLDLVFGAQLFHQGEDGVDVLDQRDVRQMDVLAGEQAGRDGRQDGVLRPADADLAPEAQVVVPPDADAFHGTLFYIKRARLARLARQARYTLLSAWSRSAMMSSGSSPPTQSRMSWGGMSAICRASSPCWECVEMAGMVAMLLMRPRSVAR